MADIPPEISAAEIETKAIQAFMKGAAFGEWREAQNPSGQAWRLAHLAGILMSADVAAGARCFDVSMWIDRAEDLLAEADRRVTLQDGAAP
jgi:hypothetical protein